MEQKCTSPTLNALMGLLAVVLGVAAIYHLECMFIAAGHNGTMFTLSVSAIVALVAGYCGFNIKKVWPGK